MCVLRQENMRIKLKIVKKWKILQKTAPFLIIGMAVITAGSFFCGRYFYADIERGKKQLAAAFWNAGEEILWKQIFPLEVRKNNEDGYEGTDNLKKQNTGSDPAYEKYRQTSEFYRTHGYLAWIGEDEADFDVDGTGDGGSLAVGTGENVSSDGAGGGSSLAAGTEENVFSNEGSRPDGNTADAKPRIATYPLQKLMDYDFLMKHFYNVHTSTTADRQLMNAENLLSKDITLQKEETLNPQTPQILIYHTHSQESYKNSGPDENVTAVGGYLAELLTEKGWSVYHDKGIYDLQNGKMDRSKAYNYALEGLNQILAKYPSIQVILDIHRDGVGENVYLKTDINGKATARIMFFNGLSQTPEGPISYLPNPYREENLAFSLKMQLKAEEYYPGFTRKIYLKGLRYNEHLRPRSALIEVGAQTNTFEEAKNAMEPLAELLDMVLQGN